MKTLKVDKLNFSYGKRQILKNITFNISDGLIGILGPNGAGKTTLIKILATLLFAKEGNIEINNISYMKNIVDIRKILGYLPQNFKAYPQLTGREFLEFVANIKIGKDKEAKSRSILETVNNLNMHDFINDKIKTYSGGMLQRLGIAQSLIGNPQIIIVDEPTAGLDPEQRNNFRKILPIISKGRIVIVSTHIVEDIEYYCDYLLLLDQGEIKYKGDIQEFLNISRGKIWRASVDRNVFNRILDNSTIIDSTEKGDVNDVVYINNNRLTKDSVEVEASLQYVYLYYQNMKLAR